MDAQTARKNASVCLRAVTIVKDYARLNAFNDLKQVIKVGDTQWSLYGLYLRTVSWLSVISNSKNGVWFQAVDAGVRSLFETLIDMILIHYDESGESTAKMMMWERSAKLNTAEGVLRYYANKNLPLPDSDLDRKDLVDRERAAILEERFKFWKNRSHSNRWTANHLGKDAIEADKLHKGLELERFAEVELKRLHWNVHGSGLITIRNLNSIYYDYSCGIGFIYTAKFGMECCKLAFMGIGDMWKNDRYIRERHTRTWAEAGAAFPRAQEEEPATGGS